MNHEVFFNAVAKAVVSPELTDRMNQIYKSNLPNEVARLFSVCPEGCFLEGNNFRRLMSIEEIANAPSELHVNFASLGIIPLFDTGDNDFIVYDFIHGCWKKFNIVDETPFGAKKTLQDIL